MDIKKAVYLSYDPSVDVSSEEFQLKYKILSEFFTGYVITASSKKETLAANGFTFVSIRSSRILFSWLRFFMLSMKSLYMLKKNKISIDFIESNDPLKTGLIGCIYKSVLHSRLILVANVKDKDSPVEVKKEGFSVFGWFRSRFVSWVIRCVVGKSDGIKVLYPNPSLESTGAEAEKSMERHSFWVSNELFVNLGETSEILFMNFPYRINLAV
jgi:hypothetical protein